MRVLLLTATAMVAFAGNSVLCRLALVDSGVDPASFTVVRLLAAAATLSIILLVRGERPTVGMTAGSWTSAVTLMAYAVAFSWAYVRLDAATGALILFGTVQFTMIVAGLLGGERPGGSELAGWLLAAAGLIWLLLPGSAAPSLTGTVLMAIAGIGWGLYSLYGRGETRPVLATAGNFLRVLPFCLPLAAYAVAAGELTVRGFIVATIAGSLTTGIGYVPVVRGTAVVVGAQGGAGAAVCARDCDAGRPGSDQRAAVDAFTGRRPGHSRRNRLRHLAGTRPPELSHNVNDLT